MRAPRPSGPPDPSVVEAGALAPVPKHPHPPFLPFTVVLFTAASPLVVDEPFDIDVTSSVGDDLMHRFERNSLSEYRLRFDESTDNDDSSDQVMFWNYPAVHTSCDGACLPYQIPHLTVTYLVP